MQDFLAFLVKSPFNLLLFGMVIGTGTMLVWPLVARLWRRTKDVGTFEAVQLINRNDAVVLDVRETGDYSAGHISGARHIPEAQVGERLKELEKFRKRPIIVVCRTGSRSAIIADFLNTQDFGEVVSLRGGMGAWEQASLPLEKR